MPKRKRARRAADRCQFSIPTSRDISQIWSALENGFEGKLVRLAHADEPQDHSVSRWAVRDNDGLRDVMTLKIIVEPASAPHPGSAEAEARVVVRVRDFLYKDRSLGLPPAIKGAGELREVRQILTQALR